ncbi:MAG: GNAT family N-acetyltransferase [Ornithinimicrobium sp.]
MTVVVRPATTAELADVGPLVAQAYLDDGLLTAEDDYLHAIRDATGRARDSTVLVAVDHEGTVVGAVTWCSLQSSHREVARADEGEFRMLGVATAGRGQGIGELLVRECVALARADGLAGLVICTSPRMVAARRIYERLGFTRIPELDWMPVPDFPLWAYRLDLRRS